MGRRGARGVVVDLVGGPLDGLRFRTVWSAGADVMLLPDPASVDFEDGPSAPVAVRAVE